MTSVASAIVVVVREVGEGLSKLCSFGEDFGPKEFVPKLVEEVFNPVALPGFAVDE